VQRQPGLKLEARKGPVEADVIDHVEKPSANQLSSANLVENPGNWSGLPNCSADSAADGEKPEKLSRHCWFFPFRDV
jgi:hypothetical protein